VFGTSEVQISARSPAVITVGLLSCYQMHLYHRNILHFFLHVILHCILLVHISIITVILRDVRRVLRGGKHLGGKRNYIKKIHNKRVYYDAIKRFCQIEHSSTLRERIIFKIFSLFSSVTPGIYQDNTSYVTTTALFSFVPSSLFTNRHIIRRFKVRSIDSIVK